MKIVAQNEKKKLLCNIRIVFNSDEMKYSDVLQSGTVYHFYFRFHVICREWRVQGEKTWRQYTLLFHKHKTVSKQSKMKVEMTEETVSEMKGEEAPCTTSG